MVHQRKHFSRRSSSTLPISVAASKRTNPHRRKTRRTALRPRRRRGRTQGRAEEAGAIPPIAAESRRRRRAHCRVACSRKVSAGDTARKPARNCWSASSPNAAPAGKPSSSPSSRSKAKPRLKTGRRNTPSRCSRIPRLAGTAGGVGVGECGSAVAEMLSRSKMLIKTQAHYRWRDNAVSDELQMYSWGMHRSTHEVSEKYFGNDELDRYGLVAGDVLVC